MAKPVGGGAPESIGIAAGVEIGERKQYQEETKGIRSTPIGEELGYTDPWEPLRTGIGGTIVGYSSARGLIPGRPSSGRRPASGAGPGVVANIAGIQPPPPAIPELPSNTGAGSTQPTRRRRFDLGPPPTTRRIEPVLDLPGTIGTIPHDDPLVVRLPPLRGDTKQDRKREIRRENQTRAQEQQGARHVQEADVETERMFRNLSQFENQAESHLVDIELDEMEAGLTERAPLSETQPPEADVLSIGSAIGASRHWMWESNPVITPRYNVWQPTTLPPPFMPPVETPEGEGEGSRPAEVPPVEPPVAKRPRIDAPPVAPPVVEPSAPSSSALTAPVITGKTMMSGVYMSPKDATLAVASVMLITAIVTGAL